MQCPSHEELRALAAGELDATSRDSIRAHLDECASCNRVDRVLAHESGPSRTLTSHSRALVPRRAPPQVRLLGPDVQAGAYVGRYLVIDLIGTGGMGAVYRAYDPKLHRNVAVKLIRVRPDREGSEPPRSRLLREAQALAQVVHPHVVSIFDVGEFGEQVFFAMELIEGSTLRDVMRGAKHDRRTLLRLLDQAGRGLVAAHDVGLVHRDFKPENVLVDRELRAKVVDFGLARAVDAHKSEDLVTVSPGASPSVLDQRITETGAFIGTPAYMAPEQYLGSPTDARSDQFSFSCVVYEALFGRHPFLTKDGKISMVALCAGEIESSGQRLDRGYLRVLSRGLSRDPANRYPSLEHLLDELSNVPGRRRRRVVAMTAGACAVVGLLGLPATQKQTARRCDAAATQALADIWDTPRREKVEGVLAGDGKAFGRDVGKRVAAALDGYAEQWKRTSVELCRAEDGWRAEDEARLARSSACVAERRRELRAVTDVLAGGDQDMRLHAPDTLVQLGSVSSCTNAAALAQMPLPVYDKATAGQVERIRDLLAQSRARSDAGNVAPAEDAARQALELARKQNDRALAAEALYRLSVAQVAGDAREASEASVVQALAEAESSGHERLMPLLWTQLIEVVGIEKDDSNEVVRLVPLIEATVQRLDPQGPAHVELLRALGTLERARGRYDRAMDYLLTALEMSRGAFAENDIRRTKIYHQLALTERSQHQLDKGIAHARAALAETEALFGNDHPQLMKTLSLLARMLIEQGDRDGAQAVGQRALGIVEQASSPGSTDVGTAVFQLGTAYLEDGQPALALPLLKRSHEADPVDTVDEGASLAGIARAEEALGHLETARTTFEEAVAILRRRAGPGHPQTIKVGVRLGRLLRTLHLPREALELCTQLRDAGEHTQGSQGAYVALALSCVGEGDEQLGRLPEARVALERAEKLLAEEKTPPRPDYVALVHFALARVLWQTNGDRARARRLANEALDAYQHAGRLNAENVAAVQTWLAMASAPPH